METETHLDCIGTDNCKVTTSGSVAPFDFQFEDALEHFQRKLALHGAHCTPIGLRLPDNLSERDWAQIGIKLHRSSERINWWIGDWAAFGAGDERADGWRKRGALKEFCELNGIPYGTVKNRSYVSSNVLPQLRKENLPWSFYAEVAPLKPKEQRSWLDKAAKDNLSVSDLRRKIRLANGEFNALRSEGPSIELGTQHYDDMVAWLGGRQAEFWTDNVKRIWRERLAWFEQFSKEKLV